MAGTQLHRWDADDKGRAFDGGINDVVVTANGGAYATVFGPYKGYRPCGGQGPLPGAGKPPGFRSPTISTTPTASASRRTRRRSMSARPSATAS